MSKTSTVYSFKLNYDAVQYSTKWKTVCQIGWQNDTLKSKMKVNNLKNVHNLYLLLAYDYMSPEKYEWLCRKLSADLSV
jgi:DNA-binding Lrp family transcriptional regulator